MQVKTLFYFTALRGLLCGKRNVIRLNRCWIEWKDETECGTETFNAFKLNGAAVDFHNFFGNGKPQSGACLACGGPYA